MSKGPRYQAKISAVGLSPEVGVQPAYLTPVHYKASALNSYFIPCAPEDEIALSHFLVGIDLRLNETVLEKVQTIAKLHGCILVRKSDG